MNLDLLKDIKNPRVLLIIGSLALILFAIPVTTALLRSQTKQDAQATNPSQALSLTRINNPLFETNSDWKFAKYQGNATFTMGNGQAEVVNTAFGTKSFTQLYQSNISLQKGQSYNLTIDVTCPSSNTVAIDFIQHTSPYTFYSEFVDTGNPKYTHRCTGKKQTITQVFTATQTSNNARIRILFPKPGTYTFDEITLAQSTGNVIKNPSFSDNQRNWLFAAYQGTAAFQVSNAQARISNTRFGTNQFTQLFQRGIALQKGTTYDFSFDHQCEEPNQKMKVSFIKNTAPYTPIALFANGNTSQTITCNQTTQTFTTTLTAIQTHADTRLRVLLSDRSTYTLDNFYLSAGSSDPVPTDRPRNTPTPRTPTRVPSTIPTIVPTTAPTTAPPSQGNEILLYDGIRQFEASDRGFLKLFQPGQLPKRGMPNNWITPDNYYEGTWHFRYTIVENPSRAAGQLQTCIWAMPGYKPESCSPKVPHNGLNTYTAQAAPSAWWKLNGVPLNFANPEKFLVRVVLRGPDGCNVTSYNGVPGACWDKWNDYKDLRFRVTIVMTPKGSTFSGWQNYR